MTSDSYLFFDESAADRLSLYEAKLINHYGLRWATYTADGSSRDVALAEKQDPVFKSHRAIEWRAARKGWYRQWLIVGEISLLRLTSAR